MSGNSAHLYYRPIKQTHNKYLQALWDNDTFAGHRRKVATAIPVIDTTPPSQYIHLHLKLKKLQLEEERLATVERDNNILLKHMRETMKGNGIVDHKNNYKPKSLNREKRIREILRVAGENREFLKRLNNVKPQYDTSQWDKEWHENRKFIDNISCYPRDWWKLRKGSQKKKSRSASSEPPKSEGDEEEDKSADNTEETNEETNEENTTDNGGEKTENDDGEVNQTSNEDNQ